MEPERDLTIILPIYNPIDSWDYNLEQNLSKIFKLFKDYKINVILVNDGSSISIENNTKRLKKTFSNLDILSYQQNRGKGYAIRAGLKQAKSSYYIYTDWDFPFGVDVLFDIFSVLETEKYDLVIGSRSKKYFQSLPLFRKCISESLRTFNFFLLKFKKIDTQAGIKGLNSNMRDLFLTTKTNSFIFELEFIKLALRRKNRISIMPVEPVSNIVFTNFKFKTIANELLNLGKLIINRK